MDINCDLGEGEPLARTSALMRLITSANIACGGHAGDEASMRACLQLCRKFEVHAGAHPGYEDREDFGRVEHPLTPQELRALLARQVGALARLAGEEGVPVAHLKLHGALYHAVEKSADLAGAAVDFVQAEAPHYRIVALAGGRLLQEARDRGLEAWGEIFAERGYRADGTLIPRNEPGALLSDLAEIRHRAQNLPMPGETICVHADSPGAVEIAQILAEIFRR